MTLSVVTRYRGLNTRAICTSKFRGAPSRPVTSELLLGCQLGRVHDVVDAAFLHQILRDDRQAGRELPNRDVEPRAAGGRGVELERVLRACGFDDHVLAETADFERHRDGDRGALHDHRPTDGDEAVAADFDAPAARSQAANRHAAITTGRHGALLRRAREDDRGVGHAGTRPIEDGDCELRRFLSGGGNRY